MFITLRGTSGDERQAFKMVWLEDFQKYVMELQKSRPNLILCGDYNICHEPIDIHDPVRNATNSGFLPEEREWMTRFLSAGYVDSFRTLCPEKQEYTWWSYRFNSRAKNKVGELTIAWLVSRYAAVETCVYPE